MINIKVNNTFHKIQPNSTVQMVLITLAIPVNGIAVAINQDIITNTDWDKKILIDGDQILIITATQGG
ncbi:sulfur carrier protein [Nonlabens xylanidelens]|uniref:Sulfur carrier protein n=1 Tax=Nonlabens xylanidelens TaxID=191564 RepID=A0A2S6IN14_9FLAO|nr:sulfur carrier protein ThiS [Nonlabens xylanidelens]PPK95546.1 sulfur carrier protein [Nonlabens xylanidelens]PQJ22356.1 thiamine biosynthesis protein ThiS [Nonlabens xylanidelens]